MSFIEESLLPKEVVIYKATLSPLALILPAMLATVSCALLFALSDSTALICLFSILGLLASANVLKTIVDYATTEFGVTNMRVIAKKGGIGRNSVELRLSQIESVKVEQGIMGRLFNFGTIIVTGSGGTSSKFPIISKPMELRKQVNTQIAQQ